MIVLLGFAFISGVVTILSPCILPVLPIVLSGSVGGGRARPLGIVAGFVVSFTVFTLSLSAIVQVLGIPPDALRVIAVVVLIAFGIVMIVPALKDRFQMLVSQIVNKSQSGKAAPVPGAQASAPVSRWNGFWSGVPVGISLGLVWTPCVGPIMASVITLALSSSVGVGAVFITLAYTLGTSIPMLGIMMGGRALVKKAPWLTKHTSGIQRVFGVLMIGVAIAISFGWDRAFQTALLNAFPGYGSGLTAIEENEAVRDALSELHDDMPVVETVDGKRMFPGADRNPARSGVVSDYGMAPDFVAKGPWLNTSSPLTPADLAGKVVVYDFWTYSCINCVRTLPYIRDWYARYKDAGLVIIGVHSPEFAFEREPENVRKAIADLNVTWPVVLDNDFSQWRAYRNRYWPAHFFVDATGNVRYFHFGEGDYVGSEQVIRTLLAETGAVLPPPVLELEPVRTGGNTHETYLGTRRAERFAGTPSLKTEDPESLENAGTGTSGIRDFIPGESPLNEHEWRVSGKWQVGTEFIASAGEGVLEMRFTARNVFLVITPPEAGMASSAADPESSKAQLAVTVDGAASADTGDVRNGILLLDNPRMYQLVGLPEQGTHDLRIEVPEGTKLYAFTFG